MSSQRVVGGIQEVSFSSNRRPEQSMASPLHSQEGGHLWKKIACNIMIIDGQMLFKLTGGLNTLGKHVHEKCIPLNPIFI